MICCSLLTDIFTTIAMVLFYYYLIAIPILLLSRTLSKPDSVSQDPTFALRRKTLMLVFGSGGHTTELLLMLTKNNSMFDFSKYKEVQFVIGHSDTWSLTKIRDFLSRGEQKEWEKQVKIVKVFRAREVKQSYVTSIGTTLLGLAHSVWIIATMRPDIVVTNGPGTAVPLCYAHFALSKILLWNTRASILFIESYCRVTSLSLSGKLLYPIATKFIVHWEELKQKHPRALLFKDKII